MSSPVYLDEETKEKYRYAFEKAREDRPKYFNWIKDEIKKAENLINTYDKIFVLGGLGARLLQTAPNLYNQFIQDYDGPEKEEIEKDNILDDDEIEVLLEYGISIASASPNLNAGTIPTLDNIQEIRDQLSKIKYNVGFYEMSAENPSGGNEFDHWIKLRVMEDALHVRGQGYHSHTIELYKEIFSPHDGFLNQYYGFDSQDIFNIVERLNLLIASKTGNIYGSKLSYDRFAEWGKDRGKESVFNEMRSSGKSFIRLFTEENPDLFDARSPEKVTGVSFTDIQQFNRLFWVIPKSSKEKKIFELLSHSFGDNSAFSHGKYGGFPLGDSLIHSRPLIKVDQKYYSFSINLLQRNLFNITANLLELADSVYFEQKFRNNASITCKDNIIELKAKRLFEKFLPSVVFYHSLDYEIVEDGIPKKTELDILGVGNDTLYIVEVKAGELNKKHRRGAILGLKDRLKETVNEGSYQCYRAEKYINESSAPAFTYVANGQRKILSIDKSRNYSYVKISVTYEHLSTVSVNLKYLIESGVLSESYKWTWIVSLYDLMIFADLIESEADFKEYLINRLSLYERSDIEFMDEIDILGYYFSNGFPLGEEKKDEKILMISYSKEIDTYYTRKEVGLPLVPKPRKVERNIRRS